MKIILNSNRSKLKNLVFLFIFSFFSIVLSSISTYVFLEYRKDKYPGNKQLSEFSTRLKYAFVEARNTKKNSSIIKKELFNKENFIESFWHNINKKTFNAEKYLYDYYLAKRLPGGYIDYINEKEVIGVNGKGEIFLYKPHNNKISKINTNLNLILKKQNFKEKGEKILYGKFGVRDIYIDRIKNRILISSWLDINNNGCYGMGIYEAPLKLKEEFLIDNSLDFNLFFKTKECNNNTTGHASGGRIKRYNDKIIFTIGSLDTYNDASVKTSESLNNPIGKIIAIDKNKDYEILSLGHRNQQGLTVIDNKIIITEHGPKGGDEINIISPKKTKVHYGWPFYSYAYGYDNRDKYRSPHLGKYKKPIFYFSPSIAISEIIYYKGTEFPKWKNKFIVSSLKDKSIYLLDFDKENNRLISKERINIGHRIRDLIEMPNGKILIITDDQKLITISRSTLDQTSSDNKKIPFKKK